MSETARARPSASGLVPSWATSWAPPWAPTKALMPPTVFPAGSFIGIGARCGDTGFKMVTFWFQGRVLHWFGLLALKNRSLGSGVEML